MTARNTIDLLRVNFPGSGSAVVEINLVERKAVGRVIRQDALSDEQMDDGALSLALTCFWWRFAQYRMYVGCGWSCGGEASSVMTQMSAGWIGWWVD